MKTTEFIAETKADQHSPVSIPGATKKTNEVKLAEKTHLYIEKNCQPWLQQAGKLVVFRGMWLPNDTPNVFTKQVRTTRKPKDTSKQMTAIFNAVISAADGVANRTNSAFVSGDADVVNNYGYPYVVFPVGDFRYTWSPEYNDWTDDFEDYKQYLMDKLLDTNPKTSTVLTDEDLFYIKDKTKEYKKLGYSKSVLTKYVNAMIRSVHNYRLDQVVDFADPKNYDKSKVKKHIYADKGLKTAIKSRNEIMVHAEKILCIDRIFYNKYF